MVKLVRNTYQQTQQSNIGMLHVGGQISKQDSHVIGQALAGHATYVYHPVGTAPSGLPPSEFGVTDALSTYLIRAQ